MTVKHRPNAAEIVCENSFLPICFDIGVASQINYQIFIKIHVSQLTMNAWKQIHLFISELNERISVFVEFYGKIFELRDLEDFLTLRRRSCRRGRDQSVSVQQRNDIFGQFSVNQIVIQKFLGNRCPLDVNIADQIAFVAVIGMKTRQTAAAIAIFAADFVNYGVINRSD